MNALTLGNQTLDIENIISVIGNDVTDAIIENIIKGTETGSVQKISNAVIIKYGEAFLTNIMKGDFTDINIEILKLVRVLFCSDILLKTELRNRMLHSRRQSGWVMNIALNSDVVGYVDWKYQVAGKLLSYNSEIAILQNMGTGDLQKVDLFTLETN